MIPSVMHVDNRPKVELLKMLGENANPANRQGPAWKGLGTDLDRGLGATEAVRVASLDYSVELRPLLVDVNGHQLSVDTQKAIVKMPRSLPNDQYEAAKVFGYVTNDYKPVNNLDLGRILDPVTERFPVISLGAFNEGARAWFCLDAGNSEVGRDEIKQYFVVQDWKNGRGGSTIVLTPMRPVCMNTLSMSLRLASVKFDVAHRGDNLRDLEFAAALMTEMELVQERTLKVLRRMTEVQVTSDWVEDVLAAAYPYPTKPRRAGIAERYTLEDIASNENLAGFGDQFAKSSSALSRWEAQKVQVDAHRETSRLLLERFNDEHAWAANTAWALYNAVTENSDWRRGGQKLNESVLFGYRAQEKIRGFEAIVAGLGNLNLN